jgi:hypothetical protein
MTNSIIKNYNRITVFVTGLVQRKLYIHDVYALVHQTTNEISLFAKDTNALLYERLRAVDFSTPTGTALQIVTNLGLQYVLDSTQNTNPTTYTHLQSLDSDTWTIAHPLNKKGLHVTVTLTDDMGSFPTIQYLDNDTIKLTFDTPQSGTAYIS